MNKYELLAEIKRKELTVEEMSKVLGIHRITLGKKINGLNDFTLSEVNKITNYLDISDDKIKAIFFD